MHFGIRLPARSPSPRSPKRRCTSPRPCLNPFSAARAARPGLHWPPLPIRGPIAGGVPMYTRPLADGLACTRTHMHPYAPRCRCGPILYAPALAPLQGRRAPMDGCVCVRVIEGRVRCRAGSRILKGARAGYADSKLVTFRASINQSRSMWQIKTGEFRTPLNRKEKATKPQTETTKTRKHQNRKAPPCFV